MNQFHQSTDNRIHRLEGQVFRLKAALILFGILFISLPLLGLDSSHFRSVTAESFVLQNQAGQVMAEFSLVSDHSPRLLLYDGQENPRATFLVTEKGVPSVALLDANGKAGVGMGIGPDGNPTVSLLDSEGASRARLFLTPEGNAELSLRDGRKKGEWNVSLSRSGATDMRFLDSEGILRVSLKSNEEGQSGLIFSDGEAVRAALGFLKNFDTTLVLTDRSGQVRFQAPEPPAKE